jgi:hypothetical protein
MIIKLSLRVRGGDATGRLSNRQRQFMRRRR